MSIDPTETLTSNLPIRLTVAGTPIGSACALAEDIAGGLRFEGLDVLARVFFAERVGPGGPGDDIMLRDVCVWDDQQQRTMRAVEARVRHFSAGTGALELIAAFREATAAEAKAMEATAAEATPARG